MKPLVLLCAALALAGPAAGQAQSPFKRPDCSAYAGAIDPEAKCIRETRRQWQEANFAALQKTGLMFVHMARPDLDANPAARKAFEEKVEGSFAVRFSVAADGTVYNVRAEEITDGIEPLARLWADTIAQWTFAKNDAAATDIPYRRIYLYSSEDDERSRRQDVQ